MVKNFLIALKSLQQSKRAIQKKAEATDDLIGNRTADKVTSVPKNTSTKELHNNDEKQKKKM